MGELVFEQFDFFQQFFLNVFGHESMLPLGVGPGRL
jgi:hypothetical protein